MSRPLKPRRLGTATVCGPWQRAPWGEEFRWLYPARELPTIIDAADDPWGEQVRLLVGTRAMQTATGYLGPWRVFIASDCDEHGTIEDPAQVDYFATTLAETIARFTAITDQANTRRRRTSRNRRA